MGRAPATPRENQRKKKTQRQRNAGEDPPQNYATKLRSNAGEVAAEAGRQPNVAPLHRLIGGMGLILVLLILGHVQRLAIRRRCLSDEVGYVHVIGGDELGLEGGFGGNPGIVARVTGAESQLKGKRVRTEPTGKRRGNDAPGSARPTALGPCERDAASSSGERWPEPRDARRQQRRRF